MAVCLTTVHVRLGAAQLDDSEVINFLLQTEIIPLCLRIMETGSELSKTVRGVLFGLVVATCVSFETRPRLCC